MEEGNCLHHRLLNHATILALHRLRVCVYLFRVCTALPVYLSIPPSLHDTRVPASS
jgi:hypothetical protein